MKIVVLILGARTGQYPEIINNSFNTWASYKHENIYIYAYYGANMTGIVNNELLK